MRKNGYHTNYPKYNGHSERNLRLKESTDRVSDVITLTKTINIIPKLKPGHKSKHWPKNTHKNCLVVAKPSTVASLELVQSWQLISIMKKCGR